MIQYCIRISLWCLVFAVIIPRSCSQNCTFKYKTDFPDKESVLLWNFKALIEPENDIITIKSGRKFIVACPGTKNVLHKTREAFSSAECVSGQTLKIQNLNLPLRKLKCVTSVTGEFQATDTTCGASKGFIYHIGYNVSKHFLKLYDICYNNKSGEALFADHVIFGSAIANAKSLSARPSFKVGGLASGVNADTNYKKITQLKTFTNLLGSADFAEKYISGNSYLAKGHLAPDADQVYVTSKLSTYFYMNTVPQWQQINNGNWKSLEYSIRKVATISGENLRVITGGWKVLELKTKEKKLTRIYLSANKLPVPKFVWKILLSSKQKKGIAFVNVNNPFSDERDENKICTDVCNKYGWGSEAWSNATRGFLYCCKINDLRKKVKSIPYLEVISTLKGPSAR